MNRMNTRLAIGVVLLLAVSLPGNSLPMEDSKKGVIVEEVTKGSAGEQAGLRQGDIIVTWARGNEHGEVNSPFDITAVIIEQSPRGRVTLEGLRGATKQVWTIGLGKWGLATRPQLPEELQSRYRKGQDLASEGKATEAAEYWMQAATAAEGLQLPELELWLLSRAGALLAEARQWDSVDRVYQRASTLALNANPAVAWLLLRSWAGTYGRRSNWTKAKQYYHQALEIGQKLAPEGMRVGSTLNDLGTIAWERGDLAKAEGYYLQALEIGQRLAPGSLQVGSTFNNLGILASERGDLAKAEEYFRHDLEIEQRLAPGGLDVSSVLNNLGNIARERGELTKADEYHHQALDIRQKLAPESLDVAISLQNLGNVALSRGDLAKADDYYHQALDIRQKLAPDSLNLADSLSCLGIVAWRRGDLTKAEEYYSHALTIQERLVPGSPAVGGTMENLGIVARDRGDLAKAEQYLHQSLDIQQKATPYSLDVAHIFANLGNVVSDRGDLAKAEEYYRQALEIQQKLAPQSVDVASIVNDLGDVAAHRGDLAKAVEYNHQALTILERLAPRSLDVASVLSNLGVAARKQGDAAKAKKYLRQALEIRQRLAPGSLDVAESFIDLGDVARGYGDPVKAEEYYRRALDIVQKLAPESLTTAECYNNLADVARDRLDAAKAEKYYRQALAIRAKLAPESKEHAESLASLAGVMRHKGQSDPAGQLYEQALNAFESQIAHLGGAEETRSNFRASHSSYFTDYIDLLMSEKKPDLAFHIAERWRARSLLEMLAEARVDIRQGVDPELRGSERSLQESLKAKSDRRIRLLTAEHPNEKQVAEVEKEISDLRNQYDELQGRIRAASPVYAALTHPQPVTAKETEQLLDDDTLLLEYSLGEERSYVWVLTSNSLSGYELPKRATIEALARRVYQLLSAEPGSARGRAAPQEGAQPNQSEKAFWTKASALSRMILGPIASQLQAKRLLIVGDGALQYIPFAVLPDPNSSIQPLMVTHEMVYSPSASVIKALRQRPPDPRNETRVIAVLADPVFTRFDSRVRVEHPLPVRTAAKRQEQSSASSSRGLSRSVHDAGWNYLPRLPFSHEEARAITAVTRPDQRLIALGFKASRAMATSPELGKYRVVHFATHALLDEKYPEASGLVLAMVYPGGQPQDGFLDLGDIYNLNLPVDLVVLSACKTALGKEIKGEGLIGLTRGFMYAGASRVMASLWSVDDAATSELMRRFYKAMLVDGLEPAAALRRAQLQMWKNKTWKHPYNWAAFVIQGEWQSPADIATHR
ncbi:MAG TPA: tetratricopeptide repeat protein [Candidatus Angelobacter sp.]